MITVETRYSPAGSVIDSAEAETAEDALYAARTLLREATVEACAQRPCVIFYGPDGRVVAGPIEKFTA